MEKIDKADVKVAINRLRKAIREKSKKHISFYREEIILLIAIAQAWVEW